MRSLLLLLFAVLSFWNASAQYTLINHFTGSLAYGSRIITVTPSATGADTYPDFCIPPPSPHFWCGSSYTAGTYTFTSSAPVYAIKLEMEGLNGGPLGAGEYMQVYIDGSPYTLTAADVVSYSSCGSAGAPPCYIFGGNFYGPITSSIYSGIYNAGNLNIRPCHSFTSFAIYCNGVGNGVAYHISFDSTAPVSTLTATATSPVCEGDSIAFSVGPFSSGMSFAWTGPSGFSSTLRNPKRIATPAAAGSYTVITTQGGCTYTNYVNVVVKPKPSVTATGPSPVCVGSPLNLFASPFTTGETFSWGGPGGYASGLQNPTISSATLGNAGTYTVIANLNGCLDTATVNIAVTTGPTVTATSNGPVCAGDTLKLIAGPAVAGQTFSWIGPGGFTSTAQNPTKVPVTVADAGTYTVVTSAGGCNATATVNVVVKPKPNVTATGTTPICVGSTLSLFAAPYTTGETFSWTGPGGFSSGLLSPTISSVTLGNAGTYTVIANLNGCRDTATVNIVVTPGPVITASGNSPVCEGDTIKFTAGPAVPGQTFVWSGPSGFTSTLQNPFKTPSALSDAGTYTVISSVGGCSVTATVSMVVKPKPEVFAWGTTPVCVGDPIYLYSSPFVTGETFSWTGPGGYSSTLPNPVRPGAIFSYAGIYQVVTSLNGCKDTALVNISVNITPSVTATSNSPVCAGDTIEFTAGPAVAGQTFAWTGPAAFSSIAQNPFRSPALAAHSGTYRVITAIGSCSDTAFVNVVVNNKPPLTLSGTTAICAGKTLSLSASPFSAGEVFSWVGPTGFTSTQRNPVIPGTVISNTGVYTATATLNGCSTTATINVVVTPLEDVLATGNSPLCAGDNLVLNATSSVPGLMYQWVGPGSFTSTIPNPIVYSVTAANSGVYTVIGGADGCSDTSSVSIVVNPIPHITASGDAVLCEGQLLHLFAGPSAPGRTFLWSGPGWFSSTAQNATVPSVEDWATGTYIVQATENGCRATDTVNVQVVSLGQHQSGDTTVCSDKAVALLLSSGASGNSNVMWNTGSSSTQLEITKPGTYWVQISASGCIRVDTIKVKGEICLCGAMLPNAFSPNGDDLNDFYGPIIMSGCEIFDFKFAIYNRWGQQVFLSNHPKKKWDGFFQGVQAELGVYMYYLSYSAGLEKTKYSQKGDVTLVR